MGAEDGEMVPEPEPVCIHSERRGTPLLTYFLDPSDPPSGLQGCGPEVLHFRVES